jgi:hypothetical protein
MVISMMTIIVSIIKAKEKGKERTIVVVGFDVKG